MADRRRVTMRAYLAGAATAVLLFTVGVPAIVSADGGQTELIHACLLPDAGTGANVVIIGADESCPGGTATLHWPASGGDQPELDTPEIPPPTRQEATHATPKIKKKLYGPSGIKLTKTKTMTKTLGPDPTVTKDLIVSCPASHPYAVSGHPQIVEPEVGGWIVLNHSIAEHLWRSAAMIYECKYAMNICFKQTGVSWTLKVELLCASVKLSGF